MAFVSHSPFCFDRFFAYLGIGKQLFCKLRSLVYVYWDWESRVKLSRCSTFYSIICVLVKFDWYWWIVRFHTHCCCIPLELYCICMLGYQQEVFMTHREICIIFFYSVSSSLVASVTLSLNAFLFFFVIEYKNQNRQSHMFIFTFLLLQHYYYNLINLSCSIGENTRFTMRNRFSGAAKSMSRFTFFDAKIL